MKCVAEVAGGNRICRFFNCWPQWLVFVIHFQRSAFVFQRVFSSILLAVCFLVAFSCASMRLHRQSATKTMRLSYSMEKSAHSEHFLDFSRDMSMFFVVLLGTPLPMSSSHCIIGCSYQTNENDPNLYGIRPAIYDYCANKNENTHKSIQQLSIWMGFALLLSLYHSVALFCRNSTNLIQKLKGNTTKTTAWNQGILTKQTSSVRRVLVECITIRKTMMSTRFHKFRI